jgi:MurNAc alpha-1-phosphate uridylyltransferase
MLDDQVSGEHFTGFWMDIGTPERLQALHEHYTLAASAINA